MTQGDLTNEQQAVLESLLPTEKKKPGRPSPWLKRQLTDDIR
ncbi:transposase [Protofrankia symbiont of Coriaria ruscifolia]|nr:transposase [Protofrankia symbiont of Coriaria ruscifolia]